MKAKERHKCKLLEYLGNPENEFPTRLFMNSQIIGFKDPTRIYRLFSLDELDEIEAEALEIRRKKYKPGLAMADKALFDKAKDGDVAAIKLCYQKFEDWSEKQRKEHSGKVDLNAETLNAIISAMPDELAKSVSERLGELISNKRD